MAEQSLLTIVLAAGKGTRMKSDLPKVLHEIAGRSMVSHVLAVAEQAGATDQAIVVGAQADVVRKAILAEKPNAQTFEQTEQLGTAHAVLAAREALEGFSGHILVLYGDTPLLSAKTIQNLAETLNQGSDLAVLGFEAEDPTGYGRLLTNEAGGLIAIREHKDASEEERAVTLCNSGVFAFHSKHLLNLLERVENNNAKGEYYLTDVVEIARQDGLSVGTMICEEEEVLGVNSREQLSQAEAILQKRLRRKAMEEGATLIAPETVFFSHDTKLGRDVLVEPNVVFGPGVEVGDHVTLRAFSYFEECKVQDEAIIGPYARLRPGTDIGPKAKVGNFVEIKKAIVEKGAKVNHLTYIGDARVGEEANIGAGTITCNYDGFLKYHTDIGAGAFVGSNSALVAPVKIGDGAYVGSGSVITKNVTPGALALTRAAHEEREGWAEKFKTVKKREKERIKKDQS